MALLRDEKKVPDAIDDRIKRGRSRLSQITPSLNESWEFFRGNHYAYVDEKNVLQRLVAGFTGIRGQGKPHWKARQKRNLLFDVVLHAISQATSRVPGYQVVPSTPEDSAAAELARKVLHYGYHAWHLRQATVEIVTHAIVGGEGFAWPYFDTSVGPFVDGVGEGEICVKVFGGKEVFWEPGVRFERSPWHVVEHARPMDDVTGGEGYEGPEKLTPDASVAQSKGQNKEKLVMVTEYLERPSSKNPAGRWITIANKKRILPERPYPTEGPDPVLRRLSYAPDPDADRDLGLVPQLLDAQRTFTDANNKLVEWKNLALMPQWAVTPGVMKKQRRTAEPGVVLEIPEPERNLKVIETPEVPSELFEMVDRAQADIARIAAQNDIPAQVEAGKAIQALIEKDSSRAGMFLNGVAEWHGQVGHDCLVLVQDYYTEPRLIQIKGDWGWDSERDFRGKQLRNQTDVRVFADSIEPQTRQAIEQRVMNYAQLGVISPDQAVAAIESGSADAVVRSIVLDETRAGRVIQRLREGPDSLFSMPELPTGRMEKKPQLQAILGPDGQPMFDETGQPMFQTVMVETGEAEMAPGWMPRYADNLPAFRATFEGFIKTEDYERLDPEMQEAANAIYSGILKLEEEKAQAAAEAQAAQAEGLGMANASRPQGIKPLASLPAVNGSQA